MSRNNELYERMVANPWLMAFRRWEVSVILAVGILAGISFGFKMGTIFFLIATLPYLYGVVGIYLCRGDSRMRELIQKSTNST